jgi:hypothetical protein
MNASNCSISCSVKAGRVLLFSPLLVSRGDSYDNALYEAELIHRLAPWKSRESVKLATLQWVHWFSKIPLLEPNGHIPPAEAEANCWR